jgi:hypothetical protein
MFRNVTKWVIYKNEFGAKVLSPENYQAYQIGFDELDEVRSFDQNSSEVVAHLCGKTWTSYENLIDLCELIKKHKPNNRINWERTYAKIEEMKG